MSGRLRSVESATQTSEVVSDNEYDHYIFDHTPMASPRVVIDTSPAFSSVHDAILRFGGPGFWVPRPTSTLEPDLNEPEMYSVKDQSTTMLKDLNKKEQETLDILKELEFTKRLVGELKSRLSKETQPCEWSDQKSIPDKNKEHAKKDFDGSSNIQCTKLEEQSTIVVIMKELEQTKLNLNQNTNELASIRASVESLSKKIESDNKGLNEKDREMKSCSPNLAMRNNIEILGGVTNPINPLLVSKGLQELNYEAERFMNTADETRLEILKAMSGIEQTKTCLRVIQMRWVAAKKLEEAAKAAESLAVAEIKAFTNNNSVNLETSQQKPPRISLSLEEYSILMDRARKSDQNRKEFGGSFSKIEEATHEKLNNMTLEEVLDRVEVMSRKRVSFDDNVRTFGSDSTQQKSPTCSNSTFRNHEKDSRLVDGNRVRPVLRPTTSIGDILSKKLVLRDDLDMERQDDDDEMVVRQRMSLNHLLRQQREEMALPVNQRKKDNGEKKKLFSKRKSLGFVHISLPLSKSSKNRSQALN